MDAISIPSVTGVLLRRGRSSDSPKLGSLHLTPDDLIHRAEDGSEEIWVPLTLLHSVQRLPANHTGTVNPLVLRTRLFESFQLDFSDPRECEQVWDSIKALCAAMPARKAERLAGKSVKGKEKAACYELEAELQRMGVGSRSSAWRISDVNAEYEFCPTYPAKIVVPNKISDTTLRYAVKYRSKGRIPGLVYLHWANLGSITRSSQPMVGIKGARSIQDEKLIESVFTSHSQHSVLPQSPPRASFLRSTSTTVDSVQAVFGAQSANLIIDARPTTNARANSVMGAGSENMDHYKNCEKAYLGIDNIHVMRSSLNAVFDAAREAEEAGVSIDFHQLKRSNWLKHLTTILDGTILIVKTIHLSNSHVLVHCSDGWDRTSQLSSLSQLCLDPYYRTAKGLAVLIEKDWSLYGHKFAERSGLYCGDRVSFLDRPREDQSAQSAFLASVRGQFSGNSHAYKETCPVFQQWCDCIYQIMRQFPKRFEYNEAWLRQIVRAVLTGSGGFSCDNERERRHLGLDDERAWDDLLPNGVLAAQYRNAEYEASLDKTDSDRGVLLPDPSDVRWWSAFFNRTDDEMNPVKAPVDGKEEIRFVQTAAQDPVIASAVSSVMSSRPDSPVTTTRPGEDRAPSPSIRPSSSSTSSSRLDGSAGIAMPSQAQLQSTISSVQKFGWGAWKQVTKGYQEAVASYRDYSPNPSAVPASAASPDRRSRTPVQQPVQHHQSALSRTVNAANARAGVVDDINGYRSPSPVTRSDAAVDRKSDALDGADSLARWDDVKSAIPGSSSNASHTTQADSLASKKQASASADAQSTGGDPLGVGLQ